MPEMMSVYKEYSVNYDELPNFEDYSNNLGRTLVEQIDWRDKVVYEAGTGTGGCIC